MAKSKSLVNKTIEVPNRIPIEILNTNRITKKIFAMQLKMKLKKEINIDNFSKTFVAGYNFIVQ